MKKVIFIGGSSYSGSTMLDMMLANSPEGFSVGEVHALFHPFRPHHFNPECGCANTDCDFWFQVREAGEKNLYKTIFSLLPKISFIVDSSKDPWWIKKQSQILQAQGIEIRHLLIWKEPAAFAHSMLKRQRKGWMKSWKNYYQLYFSLISDYSSVAYSELVQNPDEILHKLCNQISIPYHQNQKKFWQKQHHTLFGNDSAKIHLQGETSPPSPTSDDTSIRERNEHKYRSIYHDISYLESLPSMVRRAIESDPDLEKIISVLKTDITIADIQYSTKQIVAARVRWLLKRLCGKLCGRYWWIF